MSNTPGTSGPPGTADLRAEIDRLSAENERLSSRLRLRSVARSVTTGLLVVLTSSMLVASTVAVWGERIVFDTDRFMEVVAPALEEPAFYDSLSRNISDQVIEALDLETRVRARLTQLDEFVAEALVDAIDVPASVRRALSLVDRPSFADLTPSIVDPLERRVTDRIDGFITSEEFRTRLPLLVGRAHATAVALIDEDLAEFPNVYIADGEVRLNLIPIIAEAMTPVIDTLSDYLPDVTIPVVVSEQVAAGRQELGDALQARLPDDFGQLTVLSEDALSSLQTNARRVVRGTWLLVGATIALAGATVLAARDRRRIVVWLAIGAVVALGTGWWVVRRIREAVMEQIVMTDSRLAIEALLREMRGSFRGYVLVVVTAMAVAGLVAVVAGHLDDLGRGARWVRRQRSEPTPLNEFVTAHYDALRVAGFVVAVLALVRTGVTVGPALVVGVLLGSYLLALASMHREGPTVESVAADR